MKQEFTVRPISGYLALLMAVLFPGGAIPDSLRARNFEFLV
jgi:hypothetical protein